MRHVEPLWASDMLKVEQPLRRKIVKCKQFYIHKCLFGNPFLGKPNFLLTKYFLMLNLPYYFSTKKKFNSLMYEEPIFHIAGDSSLIIECGDDGSLYLNLQILAFERMIRQAIIPGLIDTAALRTTIMIYYDPFVILAPQLIDRLKALLSKKMPLPGRISSRVISLPVWFNDRWTRECAESHGVTPNLEIIADENNMSLETVIETIVQPTWFVSYTSFQFGFFGALPMDPARVLKSSKWKAPRKSTPPGTVGLVGGQVVHYSLAGPGGAMMLGVTPVKTFDTEGRNAFFKESPLLVHPGDRVRFISIGSDRYEDIKNHIDDYDYQIEEGFIEPRNYENV